MSSKKAETAFAKETMLMMIKLSDFAFEVALKQVKNSWKPVELNLITI